jgi:hypothetical protein
MTNCAPAGQRTPGNSPQPFGPFGIRVPPFTRRDTADHHLVPLPFTLRSSAAPESAAGPHLIESYFLGHVRWALPRRRQVIAYANDRVPFGQKLIDFPASSTRFSMMAADLPDSSNGDHSSWPAAITALRRSSEQPSFQPDDPFSSGHGSALKIARRWHDTSSDRTPLARMLPSVWLDGSLWAWAATQRLQAARLTTSKTAGEACRRPV